MFRSLSLYPHSVFAILLGFFLLVPFALKTTSGHLEVYPSLVLPSGAGLVKVGEANQVINRTEVVGYDALNGEERVLDLGELFYPMPSVYVLRVVNVGKLGLGDERVESIYFKYFPPLNGVRIDRELKEVSDSERQEVIEWLARRLESLDCSPHEIVVRKVRTVHDRTTMGRSKSEVLEEIRYALR